MDRFDIIDTKWFTLSLNFMRKGDEGRHLHDHPKPFVSFILRGGYVEELADGTVRGVRWFNAKLDARTAHRVTWPDPNTVTLTFNFGRFRQWGFHCGGKWVHHAQYLNRCAKYGQWPTNGAERVLEFHRVMGQPTGGQQVWKELNERAKLRRKLIFEEYREAVSATDPANMLKELADLRYVIDGTAVEAGWDIEEAVRRVHESNLTKLDDDGKPILNDDGKVTKGPNYVPPYLEDLV